MPAPGHVWYSNHSRWCVQEQAACPWLCCLFQSPLSRPRPLRPPSLRAGTSLTAEASIGRTSVALPSTYQQAFAANCTSTLYVLPLAADDKPGVPSDQSMHFVVYRGKGTRFVSSPPAMLVSIIFCDALALAPSSRRHLLGFATIPVASLMVDAVSRWYDIVDAEGVAVGSVHLLLRLEPALPASFIMTVGNASDAPTVPGVRRVHLPGFVFTATAFH